MAGQPLASPMIEAVALTLVVLTGLYFIALATASLLKPAVARRFLTGFARSPSTHYSELFLRCLAGGALVIHAPRMALSGAFSVFGWMLILTTACLMLVPWGWHRRFAQSVVPWATRHMTLIGLSSLALGVLVLGAVFGGSA